jgi:hypothetical protein
VVSEFFQEKTKDNENKNNSEKKSNENDLKTKVFRKQVRKKIKKLLKREKEKLVRKRNNLVTKAVVNVLKLGEHFKCNKHLGIDISTFANNHNITEFCLGRGIIFNSLKMQAKSRSKLVNEMYELNAKLEKYGIEGASRESAAR